MNAGAAEWKPNFGASEWSPDGGDGDSWEDSAEPAAPAAEAATTPAEPVVDELYDELQQLLSAGEINESEFVEALLESNLPVDPEMKARVDALKETCGALQNNNINIEKRAIAWHENDLQRAIEMQEIAEKICR